jgi:hypothetical protein
MLRPTDTAEALAGPFAAVVPERARDWEASITMRNPAGVILLAAIVAATSVTPTVAAVGAEADIHASCMGIVSSRVDVGDRAYVAHLTKSTTAPTLGFPSPGAYTSYFSQFSGVEIGAECS